MTRIPAQRRASSHDVARLAGVSQSTVSLVLSGREDARISEETRGRVIAAALALRYSGNSSARALVTGRTHRIGVVPIRPGSLREQDYYGHIVSGIFAGALRRSYNLLFHSASHPTWQALCGDILGGAADGVVLVGRPANDPLTGALLDAGFPTVCASYQPATAEYHSVDCDNEMGGYLAVSHLLSLGHTSIAIEMAGAENSWVRERVAGARRAIHNAGLPDEAAIAIDSSSDADLTDEWVDPFLERLLGMRPAPTAIFCCAELQARELEERLPAYGVRVPEQVSIVGFNSTDVSERARPPLTSVWQPIFEIGEAAVDMAVDLIEGAGAPPGVRRFPIRLDIRGSTGRAPSGVE